DGEPVHFNGRNADTHWNSLAVFAAGANAFIELQIIANHGHPGQHVRPVPDQRSAFDRGGNNAVFDQIGLGRREHKFPVGDVDLPATEVDRVDATFHGADDVLRVIVSGQQVSVRHARHGNVLVAFATPIS